MPSNFTCYPHQLEARFGITTRMNPIIAMCAVVFGIITLPENQTVIAAETNSQPQIHIKARFIEVSQINSATGVGFVWYLGDFSTNGTTNLPALATKPADNMDGAAIPASAFANAAGPKVTGILSREIFDTVLHALKSRGVVKILAEPEALTTSGRQVQMRATVIDLILTNFTFQESSSNSMSVVPQTGKFEIGPTVDLVPYVLADGYTINLTAKVELLEFLGYDSATNRVYATNSIGRIVSRPTVRPGFRVQRTETVVNLWDGQTVFLGGLISSVTNTTKAEVPLLSDLPLIGRFFQSQTQTKTEVKKNLMVFVTATIIDPAGNRVHSDDSLPFNASTVPPQPNIPSPSR